MTKIYNELGISLVLGKGNWIGITCEVEDGDKEERHFGWRKIPFKNLYLRFWVYKKVLVFSFNDGLKFQNKNKIALKIIFGFCN